MERGTLPLGNFSVLYTVLHLLLRGFCTLINPRRACAARVTVVVLRVSVCLSVCLFVCLSPTILALQATRRLMSDTNSFSATKARKTMW